MSGHNKWANIKKRKGAQDAKKAQVFTKIAKMITVAAREGGGDPDMNFRLKLAVEKGRQVNMPADNIKRAIEKGAGGGKDEVQIEEIVYEVYGPEGSAALITVLTDNRNRSLGDLKAVFAKQGGSLGGSGTVAWMFEQKGMVEIDKQSVADWDGLMLEAIDYGANDVEEEDNQGYFYCQIKDLKGLRDFLDGKGLKIESAEPINKAKNLVKIDDKEKAEKIINWLETLEDLDDVEKVESNVDFDV